MVPRDGLPKLSAANNLAHGATASTLPAFLGFLSRPVAPALRQSISPVFNCPRRCNRCDRCYCVGKIERLQRLARRPACCTVHRSRCDGVTPRCYTRNTAAVTGVTTLPSCTDAAQLNNNCKCYTCNTVAPSILAAVAVHDLSNATRRVGVASLLLLPQRLRRRARIVSRVQ
jgi:hypothetical protein